MDGEEAEREFTNIKYVVEIDPQPEFWKGGGCCPKCETPMVFPSFPERFGFLFGDDNKRHEYIRKGSLYVPDETIPEAILIPYKISPSDPEANAIDDLFKGEEK